MNLGNQQFQFRITPAIKGLLIANLFVWLGLQVLAEGYGGLKISPYFRLVPGEVLFELKIWKLFTYMFLHSLSVGHLLFNMLTLWMIGTELEQRWGTRRFLGFYFFSGILAALFYSLLVGLFHGLFGGHRGLVTPVVGASGAIYALLLSYGILFGDRVMHFMFMFPMKAKHFVMILGAVEFVSLLSAGLVGSEVANLAHLTGIFSGYLGLLLLARFQAWGKASVNGKKNNRLKLVVDNEKEKNPKYWN